MENEPLIWWFAYKFIYLFLLYWVYSILFFCMPIFHIQNKFRPKIKRVRGIWGIAHRGGSRESLENTIPTFKRAIEIGSQVPLILEMDIQFTKDKVAVVCHDNHLGRIWGVNIKISETNYADLPKIQDHVDLHFATFQYHTTENDDKTIPILEDVMKACPDVPFNMELKRNDDELKTEVLKLIRKYKRESITIWGSVNEEHWMRMKRMAPDIPTFMPIATVQRILLFFFIGYLPFYRLHHDTFQFPFWNQDYIDDVMKTRGDNMNSKIYLFGLKVFNVIAKLILFHLRQRRIFVFYYSINNENDFEKAINQGVDGIITDSPQLLINYLTKKDE